MKKTLVSLLVSAILLMVTTTAFAKIGPDGDSSLPYKMIPLVEPMKEDPKTVEIAKKLRSEETPNHSH